MGEGDSTRGIGLMGASAKIDGLVEAMAGLDKLAKLSTSERDRAFNAGLRKVGRGVRKDAMAEVSNRYAIAARARSQAVQQPRFPNGSSVEIWADRKPRTVFQWAFKPVSYRTRHTKRGMKPLSWQIRKGKAISSRRAFATKGLPWIRSGSRTPINVLHGPSVHGVMRGPTMRGPISQAVDRRLAGDFVPEFQRAMERWL